MGERYALVSLSPAQIEVYLQLDTASPELKAALEETIRRKTALAAVEARRADVERQITEISADQSRLRSNLQSVSNLRGDDPFTAPSARISHELLQRYLNKLAEQETELERLHGLVAELKDEESKLTKELERYLEELTVGHG
jgi:hypothetical protein